MRFQSLGELGARAEAAGGISLDVVDPGIPLVDYEPGGLSVGTVWKLQPSIRKNLCYSESSAAFLSVLQAT